MSVMLISESGEIEEEDLNTMATGNKLKYGWRTRPGNPVWWAGVTAVCLGLFLFILIIGFTAHNTNATGHLNSLKLDLMRFEKLVTNLTKDNDALRDEQDQLKINSSRLTEEMEALKSRYDALAVNQDHLLQEVKRLNHSTADTNAIGHLNSLKLDLMRFEKLVSNLTKDNDALRDEQNQLKINSSRLTEEIEALKSQYDGVAESLDHLLQEVKRLNHSTADKICQPGWVKFNNKCYYASAKEESKTWEDSRRDCLQRKADMVIINSREELNFVTKIYSWTWIGLSDAQQEGRWKWVDGSDLEGEGFWQDGEPNNSNGNEDCVDISRTNGKWNDLACSMKLPWICED